MKQVLEDAKLPNDQTKTLNNFFRCNNLCHDCISIKDDNTGLASYNGPSVDEVTLLEMARDTTISSFICRDADSVTITINGVEETYAVIQTFRFTSERKAMSIVLKHP